MREVGMAETVKFVPKDRAVALQSTVERLEIALEKAKAGELVSVAVLGVCSDGRNYSGFSGSEDRLRFIGLLQWVLHRMLSDYEAS